VPCSIEEGVQESGAKNGTENPLADCASSAPPCKIGVKALGVGAMVVVKATCDVSSTTLQEAVVVQRLLTKVDATMFGTSTSLIAEVVTERDPAGGSAMDLASWMSTAASCGLRASDCGSEAAGVSFWVQLALFLQLTFVRRGRKVMMMRLLLLYLPVRAQLHHAVLLRRLWT